MSLEHNKDPIELTVPEATKYTPKQFFSRLSVNSWTVLISILGVIISCSFWLGSFYQKIDMSEVNTDNTNLKNMVTDLKESNKSNLVKIETLNTQNIELKQSLDNASQTLKNLNAILINSENEVKSLKHNSNSQYQDKISSIENELNFYKKQSTIFAQQKSELEKKYSALEIRFREYKPSVIDKTQNSKCKSLKEEKEDLLSERSRIRSQIDAEYTFSQFPMISGEKSNSHILRAKKLKDELIMVNNRLKTVNQLNDSCGL